MPSHRARRRSPTSPKVLSKMLEPTLDGVWLDLGRDAFETFVKETARAIVLDVRETTAIDPNRPNPRRDPHLHDARRSGSGPDATAAEAAGGVGL